MKSVIVVFSFLVSSLSLAAQTIALEEVQSRMNSSVTVCGKVNNGVFLESAKGSPTLLNMGGNYPNHLLTLLIWKEDLNNFPPKPEHYYANTNVCVTGMVIEYRGKPEIVLKSLDQISLSTESTSSNRSVSPPAVQPSKRSASTLPEPKTTKSTSPPPAAKNSAGSMSAPQSRNSTSNVPAPAPKNSSTSPVAASRNPAAAPAATNKADDTILAKDDIKLASTAAMRAGPGANYTLINQLKAGTVVTVLFSSNGWSQVVIKNARDPFSSIGYVKSSMLQ